MKDPKLTTTVLEASLNEFLAFPVFEGKSKDEILRLCSGGQIVATPHRETLFRSGEEASFFGMVLSGAYKLTRTSPAGEDVIVHFATPGEVVGAFILTQSKSTFPVTATAMGLTRFLRLPKETYLECWKSKPEMIFKVQSLLASRMNLFQEYKVMAKSPLAQKVAILLLSLLEKSPQVQVQTQGLIHPPLTRKEIAESLGASVELVIRIMSDWSKKGFLETSDQQIRILDSEKIVQEVSLSLNE